MTNEEIVYVVKNAKYDECGNCVNVENRNKNLVDKDLYPWQRAINPVWNFYLFDYRIIEPKRIVISYDLRKAWVKAKHEDYDTILPFEAISVQNKTVRIKGAVYTENELNEFWEIVD